MKKSFTLRNFFKDRAYLISLCIKLGRAKSKRDIKYSILQRKYQNLIKDNYKLSMKNYSLETKTYGLINENKSLKKDLKISNATLSVTVNELRKYK